MTFLVAATRAAAPGRATSLQSSTSGLTATLCLSALWLAGCGTPLPKTPEVKAAATAPKAPEAKAAATAPKAGEPRPGIAAGFPSAESFYPPLAKRLYREGLVVVRYCVDAQGSLQGSPTVAKSSGNSELDAAALLLATAGSGHYVAAHRGATPVPSCGQFGVRFQIAEDPRWPSLAKRQKLIEARLAQGLEDVRAALMAAAPKRTALSSWEDLADLKQYASLWKDARDHQIALLNEYISSMDALAQTPGAPPAEREAFNTFWATSKEVTTRYDSELERDSQELIKVLNETTDYYERAKPPLLTKTDTANPIPTTSQREQLRKLAERENAILTRMRATREAYLQEETARINGPPSHAVTPPGVDSGFPTPDSYYPQQSRDQLRQGVVVVRYCVDATGKLLDAPTVSRSSGSPDLDSAGVLLATAGNGHYIAGRRDGVPVAGCGELGVRFELPEDPRWPSLSKREDALNASLAEDSTRLETNLERAATPNGFQLRSWDDLAALRKYVHVMSEALGEQTAVIKEYIEGMDELARSTGAPKAEIEAFAKHWTRLRESTIRYSREMSSGVRDTVTVLTQLGDYYERAVPPLLTSGGADAVTPTPAQSQAIRHFYERTAAIAARVRATMESFTAEQQAAEVFEAPVGPTRKSQDATK